MCIQLHNDDDGKVANFIVGVKKAVFLAKIQNKVFQLFFSLVFVYETRTTFEFIVFIAGMNECSFFFLHTPF